MAKKYQKASFRGVPFYVETKSGSECDTETKVEVHSSSFEIKAITDDGGDFYIVEGYATKFFGIDTYGDRIVPGAYQETIAKNTKGFPAFFMHKSSDLPLGRFFELSEDSTGLFVKCRLPKSDTLVKDRLVPQLKAGSIDALSIGFRPTKVSFEEVEGEMIRVLEGIELKEISFITLGYQADGGALLTDLKKDKDSASVKEKAFNSMVDAHRKGATDEQKKDISELYHEMGKIDPFAEDAKISEEELKLMSKSNRVYAIRELKLSTRASNFLAELVKVATLSDDDSSQGEGEGAGSIDSKSGDDEVPPVEDNQSDEESTEKAEAETKVNAGLEEIIKSLTNKGDN